MVKSGRPPKPAAPGRILLQAAGEQRTGALVVDAVPGGTLHLIEGLVTYAESPAAPGVGELLTASGRLAPRTWEAAVDAGSADCRVGPLLVEQGHLTQGELELCVLGAIYDAGYFVLRPTSAPVEFVPGTAHWLGPVVRVDAAAVAREARRRARLLDGIFPHPDLDTAPVTPVPRSPVERLSLTALQWELLVHADGQRTPADLAQLLGRAGFATVQELRKLAVLGLLELPERHDPADRQPTFVRLPRGRGPSVDVRRPAAAMAAPPTLPVISGSGPSDPGTGGPLIGGGSPAAADGGGPADPADRPPRLPRRKPNAKLPKGVVASDGGTGHGPTVPGGADEVLLKRLRTALRALR